MTINLNPLGHSYLRDDELPEMLLREELMVRMPYDDKAAGHNPTIGIGINLAHDANLALVLDALGVFAASDASWATIPGGSGESTEQRYRRIVASFRDRFEQNPLNAPNSALPGQHQSEIELLNSLNDLLANPEFNITTGFQFAEGATGIAAAKQAKRRLIEGYAIAPFTTAHALFGSEGYQAELDDKLARGNASLGTTPAAIQAAHNTREYKALMSLYYNSKALVGPTLMKAIREGNRAEAWFQIRYGSNAEPTSLRSGIAKRRYYESQVFGLLDGAAPTLADAKSAYRMLQLHRVSIEAYDNALSAQIAQANATYQLTGADVVQTLDAALAPAAAAIVSQLNADHSHLNLSTSSFSGSSVFLDAGRDNSTESVDPNHQALLDARRYSNQLEIDTRNILIGEAGDDTLIGGRGDDVLDGGAGFDKYIWKLGDGNDFIVDADGNGMLVISGTQAIFSPGAFHQVNGSTTVWETKDGAFRITQGTTWTLTIIESGETIGLGEGFSDGKLGIRLLGELPEDSLVINGDYLPSVLNHQHQFDSNGNSISAGPLPNHEDILHGTAGADAIAGLGGNDAIDGAAGEDVIHGGDGNDFLTGGAGSDQIFGDSGQDVIFAGATSRAVIPLLDNEPPYQPPGSHGIVMSGWNWALYYNDPQHTEVDPLF